MALMLTPLSLSLLAPLRPPLIRLGIEARCLVPHGATHRELTRSTMLRSEIVISRSPAVRMQEAPFWQNVERFARFAISAVAGLILTLLSPFAAFARSPFLAAIGASIFVGILAFIYITLTSMQAPLSIATSLPVDVPTMGEASMKTMLDEIYGGSP